MNDGPLMADKRPFRVNDFDFFGGRFTVNCGPSPLANSHKEDMLVEIISHP